MMDEEDACESAPNEAEEEAPPRPSDECGDDGGEDEAEEDPQGEQLADGAYDGIFEEIGGVAFEVGDFGVPHPTDVSVEEAADDSDDAVAVSVGRVGIVVGV